MTTLFPFPIVLTEWARHAQDGEALTITVNEVTLVAEYREYERRFDVSLVPLDNRLETKSSMLKLLGWEWKSDRAHPGWDLRLVEAANELTMRGLGRVVDCLASTLTTVVGVSHFDDLEIYPVAIGDSRSEAIVFKLIDELDHPLRVEA